MNSGGTFEPTKFNLCLEVVDISDWNSHPCSYDEFLREYAVQMPYGFSIASFFLGVVRLTNEIPNLAQNFHRVPPYILVHGVEDVDRETRAQIIEMYELHQKLNLKLLNDIVTKASSQRQ